MQNPYIIVQSRHPVTLQSEVNRFAKEGYDPVGGITRHCWGDDNDTMVWFQAMYRAPEPDIDRRDLSNWDGERPVPECGTEGVLRDGDLNPVPIAGDEPLPMTWEQECKRLEKAYNELKQQYDDMRREGESAMGAAESLAAQLSDTQKRNSEFGQALVEARAGVKGAIRRAEAAEKERDEALEKLSDWGIVTKPPWALDEKVSATMDAVSALRDATEAVSKAATQPTWITITVPTGTVDLQADEWIAEDGHLRVYRAGVEVAEFPPGQWKWVMVDDPDQCDIGRKGA